MNLPPTLLGMLGISYTFRFLGRDIAKAPVGEERVFIGTYQSLGYIEGNTLTVLKPGKQAVTYQIEDWNKATIKNHQQSGLSRQSCLLVSRRQLFI